MSKEELFAGYNNEAVKELVNGVEALTEGVKEGTHRVEHGKDGWLVILPK